MIFCEYCEENYDSSSPHTKKECLDAQWKKLCPPLYRDTDPSRLNQEVLARVMAWEYGNGGGLLLHGKTRTGKTRMACLLLRREQEVGRRVAFIGAVEFAHGCAEMFKEGAGIEWIERLARVKLLLIDDLDKCKFTERVESELYGLIEKRITNARPTIVTTNVNGDGLMAKFGSLERGEAVLSRLREFYKAIEF